MLSFRNLASSSAVGRGYLCLARDTGTAFDALRNCGLYLQKLIQQIAPQFKSLIVNWNFVCFCQGTFSIELDPVSIAVLFDGFLWIWFCLGRFGDQIEILFIIETLKWVIDKV